MREVHRQTVKQIDSQSNRQTVSQPDTQRDSQTHRRPDTQADSQTDSQTDRQPARHTERQLDTQTDRRPDTQRDRHMYVFLIFVFSQLNSSPLCKLSQILSNVFMKQAIVPKRHQFVAGRHCPVPIVQIAPHNESYEM